MSDSIPAQVFTALTRTPEGSLRKFPVLAEDGLINTALDAIKARISDGEILLSVLDQHGGGISLAPDGEDEDDATGQRWAGTEVAESGAEAPNEQAYEIIVFHEHDHEPGFVPEDFVTITLSSHFTELHTVRLHQEQALRLAFLLQRAAGWIEDTFPAEGITLKRRHETDNRTWQELFPEGRTIFYEGDDPEAFRQEIKAEFEFDPAEHRGHQLRPDADIPHEHDTWNEENGWQFHCPAEHLDAIYGSRRFPMGS